MKKSILALFLLVSLLATSAFAATFTDVPSYFWGKQAIDRWADEGIITGYPDGSYKPNNTISRAEFASLIVKIFEPIKTKDITEYQDVKATDWFYDVLSKAVAMNAIDEASKTTMRPNAAVTRQEAVVILNSILGLKANSLEACQKFTDYDEIASFAENDIAAFAEKEYVIGYPTGAFEPTGTITRAEAATILNRVLALIITESGEYDLSKVSDTVLVKAKNVIVKNAEKANFVFLNEEVKETLEPLTKSEKNGFVVINAEESKSTGRSSGGSGSGTSTKTAVITVKTVTDPSGDYYEVHRNSVDVVAGGKITIKVDKTTVVSAAKVEDADSFIELLLKVAKAMDTEKIFNTLDREEYVADADVLEWGRQTAKALLADNAEAYIKVVAKMDEAHKVYSVYKAMLGEGIDGDTIKAKALELLSGAYSDEANTQVTFDALVAKINGFSKI